MLEMLVQYTINLYDRRSSTYVTRRPRQAAEGCDRLAESRSAWRELNAN